MFFLNQSQVFTFPSFLLIGVSMPIIMVNFIPEKFLEKRFSIKLSIQLKPAEQRLE